MINIPSCCAGKMEACFGDDPKEDYYYCTWCTGTKKRFEKEHKHIRCDTNSSHIQVDSSLEQV